LAGAETARAANLDLAVEARLSRYSLLWLIPVLGRQEPKKQQRVDLNEFIFTNTAKNSIAKSSF